ncbi:MAG: chaperone modulator CbpM [Bacillota bacterium]|uniref:MerR family transcriptional regulator n=1 Tax=Thermanaerosceptrum fracticalcis TaxID=1712410 RepID=A0A7G6E2Z7_THEFR|nr:chaperone modulator CbpM [Thermanaerosceptrum fracticalcis]QNB46451.1 hypothetical protein BR63_09075 [Thermanaerosceptrum fracticalcis]
MVRKYYVQLYHHTLYPQEEAFWIDMESSGYHPGFLERLAEFGIIEIQDNRLRADQLPRIQKIIRLRQSLGINLPGASVILDLLERIEELEQELDLLRRR